MPALDKEYLDFDKADVQLMIQMLKKFDELHKGTGFPDFSDNYVAYLPVFAIALLMSQQETAKLSTRLERLTWGLIFLTLVIIGLTVKLAL